MTYNVFGGTLSLTQSINHPLVIIWATVVNTQIIEVSTHSTIC